MQKTQAFVKNARKAGIYVYTDADNGNNMNRDKCIAAANKHDLSAYVSIHCDWEKADPGTLPLYLSKEDMKLAEALNRSVLRNIDIVTRGLERRTDLLELSRTKAVSCTFETGCISKDYVILQTQYKEYGKALAEGLCDYLGITSD